MNIADPNAVFLSGPVQSAGLQAEGLEIPRSILSADSLNDTPALLKRQAVKYAEEVSCKRRCTDVVVSEDISEAEYFKIGCQVAEMMPTISAHVGNINQQLVLDRLDIVSQQFVNISAVRQYKSAIRQCKSAVDEY